jgi:signal peptidase I
MKRVIPDNVVFNDDQGYNASLLSYPTNVGAPVIHIDNLVSWKSRGISTVNKQFENKFNELKVQYDNLMKAFEPVIGETYHLYRGEDGYNFLSLISPAEWNKEHLGTFQLNSDKKWIAIE